MVAASKRVKRLKMIAKEQEQAHQEVARKAVGYIRVSTSEQAITGHGLAAQERAVRAFAESQGYELVEVVTDAGVSGSTRPEHREGFRRIIELAEEKEFSVLLVWKFDRLARNLTYAVTITNELQNSYDVVLRSVTEPIDTATPMGKTIFAVLAGMAEQERQSITERTLAGKREKAAKGGFAGGSAPYGYEKNKDGGLEVNPEEAGIVRKIHSMRKEGATYQAIADTLNSEGVPTKRGGKWFPSTVRYILDNPKYRGFVEYFFRWESKEHILKRGDHESIV